LKIQNINRAERRVLNPRVGETAQDGTERPLIFRKTLSDASREQLMARLDGMIAGIDEQGERLAKRADMKDFEKYRSLIRDFMNEIISNGYEFSREHSFSPRGGRRIFATVNKVDAALDELAVEVLRGQGDKLDLLGKIGDIRGLLVDLLQ
jgi:uncharacterized protein YaaR (DUF327 family)